MSQRQKRCELLSVSIEWCAELRSKRPHQVGSVRATKGDCDACRTSLMLRRAKLVQRPLIVVAPVAPAQMWLNKREFLSPAPGTTMRDFSSK